MEGSQKSNYNKEPEWVLVIISNDDLLKWLAFSEERRYERFEAIWKELDRSLNSLFVPVLTIQ